MHRWTVALTVVLLAVLPGCAQPASARERIANAAAATQEEQSARFEMDMAMVGGGQEMTFTATGGMDFANSRSTITMEFPEALASAGMSSLKMITDGTVVYLQVPNGAQMGVRTPWLRVDAESMTGMQGLGSVEQLSNDPADSMQMLQGVSDDITEVGPEAVRGVPTTHYQATLDLDKAADAVPEDARAFVRRQLDLLGSSSLPVEVWIDDEGRLRRQRVEMDLSNLAGGAPDAPSRVTTTFELFDFGTPVDVTPPPAGEVTDFSELGVGG